MSRSSLKKFSTLSDLILLEIDKISTENSKFKQLAENYLGKDEFKSQRYYRLEFENKQKLNHLYNHLQEARAALFEKREFSVYLTENEKKEYII